MLKINLNYPQRTTSNLTKHPLQFYISELFSCTGTIYHLQTGTISNFNCVKSYCKIRVEQHQHGQGTDDI